MMTEFGGAVAVPSAVRNSDNTTTMRVNDVIMIRIDGATDSTVNSAISWIARSVTPPLPWPPPRLMLMSCAHAGTASNPAVTTVAKNKTLRGGPAALTKDSSGGRAARPSRLRDCRNRSSGRAPRVTAVVRCEALRGRPAAPAGASAAGPRDALREPAAWGLLQPGARDAASSARFGACAKRAAVQGALRNDHPSVRA